MKTNRYDQVADQILNLISQGVLKEGERIPSIRQLSQELNVSLNTVKEAYWKLENRNYIEAVPQSGFYVKKRGVGYHEPVTVDPTAFDLSENNICQVYGAYQNQGRCSATLKLGIASLNEEYWPSKKLGRYFQEAAKTQDQMAFDYMMPPGYLPLREQIARLGISAELNLSPDEIIITNGCQEAVFLAMMSICRAGDLVVLESPVYFSLIEMLEKLDLRIIELPSSPEEGINLDTLRFVLENHPVKAMFSISNFNNPMGFSMSTSKKKALVNLLEQFGVPLVEDDIYGDISAGQRPDTCKSYDNTGNVMLCSSFSKTISPGLRVGWISPGKYHDEVMRMKTLLNISTSSINQIVAARFVKEGGYERHLRNLRKGVRRQVETMRKRILDYFPTGTSVTDPEGGFLLWVTLPEEINTKILYKQMLQREILISPGSLFCHSDKYLNCMRLNAGFWNDETEKAIRTIGEACYQFVEMKN